MKGMYCFSFSPLQSIFSKGSWKGGEMFVGGVCGKQVTEEPREGGVPHCRRSAGRGVDSIDHKRANL